MECVMDYYIKHKAKWVEIEAILRLINKIAIQKIIPTSKYAFFKHFEANFNFDFHVFCKNEKCESIEMIRCGSEKFHYVCTECNADNSVGDAKVAYVTFEVENQLKILLEKHKESLIMPNEPLDKLPLKDVWNREIHRQILIKEKNPFISLTINTDGVQIFKSNSTSLWPIIICVNNLSMEERFMQDNVIICGFHYSEKLEMDVYLETFVKEIIDINERGGIELSFGNYNVFCALSTLDAPAKSKVQNMVQYNGYSGCPYCWETGSYVERMVRFSIR